MEKPDGFDTTCRAIVAIPACNEGDRIAACLAALAVQRDLRGAPVSPGCFAVMVFANNCRDDTARVARALRPNLPFPLHIIERTLAPAQSNAGAARKIVMDHAADLHDAGHRRDGVIMTTDADSAVCSTWMVRSLAMIDQEVDCVAGYIEADPSELVRLGPAFLRRGRLEDRYLAQIAEIQSLCDPLPHDPWPNHRVSSGASLAVTLEAYRAIGGLPARAVGEDAALTDALRLAGRRVRHAMEVTATTSCRFDGRAAGGAADTMRFRHDHPDAECDADIEPVFMIVRRALWKGVLRSWHTEPRSGVDHWASRLGFWPADASDLAQGRSGFEPFWDAVVDASPRLRREPALRPSQLPPQIDRAARVIGRLRRLIGQRAFRAALTMPRGGVTGAAAFAAALDVEDA